MSFDYMPLYKDTDCTSSPCYCKNGVLLMKQHLNQIYGKQVEGEQYMEFNLETFYAQISESCEVISTLTLKGGTIYQWFKSQDGTIIRVYIDPFNHVIDKIEINKPQ